MGAVGLLTALQGKDDWDAVREGEQRRYQLAILNNEMAKKSFDEQRLAAAQIQDVFKTPGRIKVLDPSIAAIQALDEKLKQPIREAILRAGGDMKKFEDEGGAILLQRYREQLMNSPEVAKGIMSAANYNKYVADAQAGLVPRGTPDIDLKAYMSGASDIFPYEGAYEQPDITGARKYFIGARGKNKYQQQPVDNETLRQYAVAEAKKKGLSVADAYHFAEKTVNDYSNMIAKGGQPYMFGADEWKPSKAWQDEQDAMQSVKYIVDGFKSVTDPNSDVWNPVVPGSTSGGVSIPSLGLTVPTPQNPIAVTQDTQTADVLSGLDLGDKTVHVAKGRQVLDKDGNPTILGADAYINVKDRLLPFLKKDGKIYMQTLAQQVAGEQPVELSEGSIDKLFTGITRTPKILSIIAKLREQLKADKNLSSTGRPDFDNSKFKGVPKGGF